MVLGGGGAVVGGTTVLVEAAAVLAAGGRRAMGRVVGGTVLDGGGTVLAGGGTVLAGGGVCVGPHPMGCSASGSQFSSLRTIFLPFLRGSLARSNSMAGLVGVCGCG